jgi:hypothetical protein
MYSFIETKLFTRLANDLLSDDEMRELQSALIDNPEAGNVVRVREVCESFAGERLGEESAAGIASSTLRSSLRGLFGCSHFIQRT